MWRNILCNGQGERRFCAMNEFLKTFLLVDQMLWVINRSLMASLMFEKSIFIIEFKLF